MASEQKTKRRQLSNEILTRPEKLGSKKGVSGEPVSLLANYFKLTSQTDWCLYQYRVDIAPTEDRTALRKALLRMHRTTLGAYVFDGTVLYTNNRLRQPLELSSIRNEDGRAMNIQIRLVGDLVKGDYHYFQFFNIIMRKCLEFLQLQLVGRNYFDALNKVEVREYRLELWPGYITSIRQHEQNVMMCADVSHKVMRNQTLLDLLTELYRKSPNNYQKTFEAAVLGNTVLTDYNNRTYRIDDVDFSSNPSSHFKMRDKSEVTYAQYYKKKYQLNIRDLKQPLLVSRSSARDRRAGNSELIYLIPELCRSTGLTDEMRNDFRLMKALSEHTRISPNSRIEKLISFNKRLMSKSEVVEEFRNWNFNLSRDLVNVTGRILPNEDIIFGDNKFVKPKDTDWKFSLQSNTPISSGQLIDWIAIVPSNSSTNAKTFINTIINVANKMSFHINRPKLIDLPDDRVSTYISAISKITDKCSPQLILCVVPNNQLQRYSAIKKKLCIDRPIPSQILLSRTLTQRSPSMMTSVGTKVAVQLNCKIGGIPWTLKISQYLPGLMVVGFDVCHDKAANGDFGAFVASIDQNFGRYYSAVSSHSSGEELSNDFALHLGRALQEFRIHNKKYPNRIIIYRDGVGEGQIPFVYDYEVSQVKKKLTEIYGDEKKCMLGFIIVTKRINTKLFYNNQNPRPGTVVDDIITDPLKYDFFIVSQSVQQGTVAPTAYNVIEDTTCLSPDRLQMLTYKFCHMYYNFSGTIRVPAPCQYAHKLAFFVSQALHQIPHQKLQNILYYL